SREEEALEGIAAGPGQELVLLDRLDALGGDLHSARPGEVDDRANDRHAALAPVDPVDEGLVDLDPVDLEMTQMGEGGIAGPEIVEGDPDALLPQLGEVRLAGGGAFDEAGLG